jgi:hypothetical protein
MFYYWANLPKYVPFNGQICWVRTVNSFFFPFLAAWDSITESFISVVTGLSYPKDIVSRWKEYATSPGKTITFLSDNSPLNALRIDINGLKFFYYSINWGDGRTNSDYFTGTILSFTHTYSVAADYTVTISTPSASITYLRINNEPVSGNLPNLADNKYLTFLQLSQTNIAGAMYTSMPWPLLSEMIVRQTLITGTFPPVNTTPLLSSITCRNTALAGPLPDFSLLPRLDRIEMDSCFFTGTIPSLSNCPLLTVLRLASNTLNGPIPSLTNNILLDNIFMAGCGVSGAIPLLSSLSVLRTLDVSGNSLNAYTSSTLALTLVSFLASVNALPSAEVNKVLADFAFNIGARPAVGTITLNGGTNGAPTGQGIIDKAAIIARGWACTTN